MAFSSASTDGQRLAAYAAREGVEHVCGSVTVSANVEPEVFESGYGDSTIDPVQVWLSVSVQGFDLICRLAREADEDQRRPFMGMELTLAGQTVPDADPDASGTYLTDLGLKDLDVSAARTYAVRSFKIRQTGSDRLPSRMRAVSSIGTTTTISILLTEARLSVTSYAAVSIRCEGQVIKKRDDDPFGGADVSIEFSEYEPDERGERAFAGGFSYRHAGERGPKPNEANPTETKRLIRRLLDSGLMLRETSDELKDFLLRLDDSDLTSVDADYVHQTGRAFRLGGRKRPQVQEDRDGSEVRPMGTGYFSLRLKHLPEDIPLLIPLLAREIETRLVLIVSLMDQESELLGAKNGLRGNVGGYGFEVQKRLALVGT